MINKRGLLAMVALLGCVVGSAVLCATAQQRRGVPELFQQLQHAETSGQAAAQLFKMGYSDARARQYLASHLPALIEADPRDPRPQWHDVMRLEWYNEVQLAAELKLSEAAPALAKWVSFRTDSPIAGLSHDASLQACPAATALVQIGDAAIPTLRRLLAQGNRDERWQAVYALFRIDSAMAKSVLGDYAAGGEDRDLVQYIRNSLETEARNKAN